MSQTHQALDISAEVARIHAAADEHGFEPVKTTLDAEQAICTLRFVLSPAEQVLISHRYEDSVHDQREAFEQVLAPTLSAAVERATGRTVATFLTATHLRAGITLLIFMFAPAAAPLVR